MKIYILDTEFLSWSKKKSEVLFRPKHQPPELIQIYVQEIFTNKKSQKLLYIRPRHYKVYPYRISKLTGIRKLFLDQKGLPFDVAYKSLTKYIVKGSLVISNGDDYKILDSNIKINKIKKVNKKVNLLDFNQIIKSHELFEDYTKIKFINSEIIKKKLKLKIKGHNAKNDVSDLIKCLKKIKFKKSHLKNYVKFYKEYIF